MAFGYHCLLKKRDDAHFATAMDRVRQIKKRKHSDGKSSALTSNFCWDQLSKMHDDETWATMFGVFLLFAKGAANQVLMSTGCPRPELYGRY